MRFAFAGTAAAIALCAVQGVAFASTWSIQALPAPTVSESDLVSVSCPTASFCMAVGSGTNLGSADYPLAEHWDGTQWTLDASPTPAGAVETELLGVSCTSATACIAVGWSYDRVNPERLVAERWDGTAWTLLNPVTVDPSTGAELRGVSCTSASDCTAVGYNRGSSGCECSLAEHWNGSDWQVEQIADPFGADAGTTDELGGVSCSSPSRCTGVGAANNAASNGPLVVRWNGSSWLQQLSDPLASASHFSGVSCPSDTTCTAVGAFVDNSGPDGTMAYHPIAQRWDGTAWRAQQMPAGGPQDEIVAVSCSTESNCMAAAGDDTPMRWQPASGWTLQHVPTVGGQPVSLGAVSCPKQDVCEAVGEYFDGTGEVPVAARYS